MKSEMPKKNSPVIHLLVATLSLLPLTLPAQQINRTVLPVPEPQPPTITELDARDAKAPPRFEVRAPKGRRTLSSFCSTTSASDNPAHLAVRVKCRRWISSRPTACDITAFTPLHFVRRRALRC